MGDLFEAIASPVRRAILDELQSRDGQTLFEICGRLAMIHEMAMTRQATSQHLEILEAAGLLTTERKGRYKYHHIQTKPLRVIAERWPVRGEKGEFRVRIHLTSVFVSDQDKALAFYTEVLGFHKKTEVPLGEFRWLTVVSPQEPDGTELLLEPDTHPAVGPYRRALVEDGIPVTSFAVDDANVEYERLIQAGVVFTQKPVDMGPVTTAVFDDTCGNLIQIVSRN